VSVVRFCPSCGAPRAEGARYCGACGADLGTAARGRPTEAAPAGPLAAGSVHPADPAPAPRAPLEPATPPSARRDRRGAPLVLTALLGVAAVLVLTVAGVVLVLPHLAGAAPSATASLEPGAIVLTSPVPQPLAGLADPSTPAYQSGTGFTPDAAKVLAVTVLRLSLEQYRAAMGAYPTTLAALFPTYAPPGPNGQPLTAAPPTSAGYAYQSSGTGYTLSVVLASGQRYVTSNPTGP
jgi:zinc-ribbon domain